MRLGLALSSFDAAVHCFEFHVHAILYLVKFIFNLYLSYVYFQVYIILWNKLHLGFSGTLTQVTCHLSDTRNLRASCGNLQLHNYMSSSYILLRKINCLCNSLFGSLIVTDSMKSRGVM